MNNASVIGKILIEGELVLKSPLLIGDGEGETSDNFRDVHVLKNQSDKPFIPGTSLCGVLRDWLENVSPKWTAKIFGDMKEMQSSIQLNDIELVGGKVIARDGVRIDSLTGTGVDGGKYDFEVVERGAKGELKLLINLRGQHVAGKDSALEEILDVVRCLIRKLQDGIRLGALTSKGFGLCAVEKLDAIFCDFRNPVDVKAWLTGKKLAKKFFVPTENVSTDEKSFSVDADFAFKSSFIVRDYEVNKADKEKNISAVTMKSCADFVIPGTSLKGILRHRAEYICDKLGIDKNFLEGLMGSSTPDKKIKSRFIVAESYIAPKDFAEVDQTRTKIDRFTGGTLQGTLFTTKPAYQKSADTPTLKMHFEIRDANDFEAGLAIFLLRDLWLGRVAIGGEKSIGRGTVNGLSAEIKFKGKTFKLDAKGKILAGDKKELESFAVALKNRAGGES